MVFENFIGNRSRKILRGLKWNVDIFLETEKIFNPNKNTTLCKYFLRFTFPTLLPSHTPCKNSKNTPHLDFIFQTRFLVYPENKIRTIAKRIFFVFLWCQGSLLTVIRPPHKLQCSCRGRMSSQQWPWHHKHS